MLKTINPLIKAAVCFGWMVACVTIFDQRFQLATILIVVSALILLDHVSPFLVLALMIPFALFGVGFLTTNLVFHEEADFARHVAERTAFTSSSLSAGLTLFLRAIAIGMISTLFALTTDPNAFVRALMVHCRMSPRVGYALFAVLQLVPDIAVEARQIRLARAMKCGRTPRRIIGPAELAGLLLPVLALAIRRAGRTAIALEARGLARAQPRTVVHAPPFRRRDFVFAISAIGLLSMVIIALFRLPAIPYCAGPAPSTTVRSASRSAAVREGCASFKPIWSVESRDSEL